MLNLVWENEQDKVNITDELCDKIRTCLERALESEEFCDDAEISLTFTDNDAIRELNLESRGKDSATDVLSFPMLEQDDDGTLIIYDEDIVDGNVLLGDIVISIARVKQQATEYEHSFEREFAYMLVHGFYHLMGEDHIEEADKKVMREKEENVLEALGLAINKV